VSRTWRTVLALFGLAVIAGMVIAIGPGVLRDGVIQARGVILPILALQGLVYGLNALSWWLTMPPDASRPSLVRTFRISVVGFAMNFVTPVVNAGGEPVRIAALAPTIGTARATGSVLVYVMVHAISSLLLWLMAIVGALIAFPMRPALAGILVAAGLVIGVLLAAALSGHRDGVVHRLATLGMRLRLRRVGRWLESRRAGIAAVDAEIVRVYHERPARLVAAIGVDTLARLVGAVELMLIGIAAGYPLGLTEALTIWGLTALMVNLLFFFPWELGSREGAVLGFFALAQMPTEVAGLAAVLGRGREIAWALLGLGLLWTENRERGKGEG